MTEPARAAAASPVREGARRATPRRLAVVPGLRQFVEGRIAFGALLFGSWTFLIGVVVLRWDRVQGAAAGPWDHRLALATLVLALGGTWTWSALDSGRARGPRGSRSQWRLGWEAFLKNRVAAAGLATVGFFYLLALLTPLVAPYDPTFQGDLLAERMVGPSAAHPLGTDQFARDVLSRLLYGARVSLSIGFVAAGISIGIGTVLGAMAGYLGGAVDTLVMRVVDMVLSFPRLVLLIAIIALFQPSIFLVVAIIGLTQWPHSTRLVRAEVLSLREREFVQAGQALGFSGPRVVARHLIPNALAPVIVAATLGIGDTIVLEAGLSFLGLGVQPPTPSWGTMIADGRVNLLGAWWISTFPGLAIVCTVLAFNLAGDGLRDALDPRLRS
jgi:peptide/nickel transport system permease protein